MKKKPLIYVILKINCQNVFNRFSIYIQNRLNLRNSYKVQKRKHFSTTILNILKIENM